MQIIQNLKKINPTKTIILSWGVLGFYRGTNLYDYQYKLNNNIIKYSYLSKVGYGTVFFIGYFIPFTIPFVIYKELYRLKLILNNDYKKINTLYYHRIL